jgi:hypothetical protein
VRVTFAGTIVAYFGAVAGNDGSALDVDLSNSVTCLDRIGVF